MHIHNTGTSSHAQHRLKYTIYNTYVATRTVGQASWRSPVTHSLCGYCALAQHNMRLAGHVHSDCITRGNALLPSCLAFLSSKISEANLHCWLRLICCRWASLSSAVSDANLGIYCWLRLICCRQNSLSSANHSLCCKTACLWSADLTAQRTLSLYLRLLNRTSLCSAVPKHNDLSHVLFYGVAYQVPSIQKDTSCKSLNLQFMEWRMYHT